jgi:hypothetical protein
VAGFLARRALTWTQFSATGTGRTGGAAADGTGRTGGAATGCGISAGITTGRAAGIVTAGMCPATPMGATYDGKNCL